MNIANVNRYHKLKDIVVTSDQLLLDPRNPRLVVDLEDDVEYTASQLASKDVQRDIFRRINKSEHHVADLIENIRGSGFIEGTAPLIVKKVGTTNSFLVLEGNRRSTAIKHLLQDPDKLDPACKKTLQKIKVKEFVYFANDEFSEEEVIDVLLGKIHISGPLSWGPMEKAHYIYKTYTRELKKQKNPNFELINECIDAVRDIYSFPAKDVVKNLTIYRVYNQLKDSGQPVPSERFTLIDLATSTARLKDEYFGLGSDLMLSEVGASRFINLCLTANGQITNPQLFKKFAFVYKEGSTEDLEEVEENDARLESVYDRVKHKKKDTKLLRKLEGILDTLEKTNLVEFANTKKERNVTIKIVNLVVNKLLPLVKEAEKESSTLPSNISQANKLGEKRVQTQIKNTIANRPNKSCMERDVVKYVLSDMGITTRGAPRAEFKKKVDKQIDRLVAFGVLQRYNGANGTRVRMLV